MVHMVFWYKVIVSAGLSCTRQDASFGTTGTWRWGRRIKKPFDTRAATHAQVQHNGMRDRASRNGRPMRAAIVATLLLVPITTRAEITGKPRIIDGDTIEISDQRIRLHGIDAPEAGQSCLADGRRWACGQNATFALSQMIGTNWVACRERDRDRYGRIVAVCHIAGLQGPDVNAMMVAGGWALAYRRFSSDYIKFENGARKSRKGVWRGTFVPPWDWRRGTRLPVNDIQPRACNIKGNIGRGGARIYHVPGGQYLARTRIDPKRGERWFCSEAEARSAGWRRSRR